MTTTSDDAGKLTLTQVATQFEADLDPLSRLASVRLMRELLATAEADAVRAARQSGASWGAIGSSLGVSKQAALKRLGDRRKPAAPEPGALEESGSPPAAKKSRINENAWELTTPGGRMLLRIRPSTTSLGRRSG